MEKVALITGAGVGIGRGIALEMARAGYDVALHCNSSIKGAEEVRGQIEAMGRKAVVIRSNLASDEGPAMMMDEFRKHFSTLDVFVNNSGITKTAPFLETDRELFDSVFGLNLRGSFFCIQQAAKYFAERNIRGSIVVISSNNDRAHFANVSVYGSVKTALTKLAEHAAVELARYGIRVNTIAPGWTNTGEARMGRPEATFYKIPLKRWCAPEEIGKAVLFLCSEAAASITGARIVMDGGALLLSDKGDRYGL